MIFGANTLYAILISTMHATCPTYLIFSELIILIIIGEE
jgi:hypothetical protein